MQPSSVVDGLIYDSDSDRSAAAAASGNLSGRTVGIVNHFFCASFIEEYDKASKIADRLNISQLPHSLFYDHDFEPTENLKRLISLGGLQAEIPSEINFKGCHLVSMLNFDRNYFEDKNKALLFLQEASHQFGWNAAQEPLQDAIGLTAFFLDEEEDFILNLKKLEVAQSSGTSFKKIIIMFVSQRGYEKFNSVIDEIEWATKLRPLFQFVVNDFKSTGSDFTQFLTSLVPEIVDEKILLVEENIQSSVKNTFLEHAQSINVFISKFNFIPLANIIIYQIKENINNSFSVQRRIDPLLDLKLYLICPSDDSLDCAFDIFSFHKKCGNSVVETPIINIFEERTAQLKAKKYGYVIEQIVKYLKKDVSRKDALINIQEFMTDQLIKLIVNPNFGYVGIKSEVKNLVENGALPSRLTPQHFSQHLEKAKQHNREYNRHQKQGGTNMSEVDAIVHALKWALNTPNRFEIFFR